MPIAVACPSCSANLKVPDHLAGKKVRCPKCKGTLAVPYDDEPEVVDMPAKRRSTENVAADAASSEEEAEDLRPRDDSGYKEEQPAEDEEPRPRKKKKKKKRNRERASDDPKEREWLPWTISLVVLVGLIVFGLGGLLLSGHTFLATYILIYLAITVPASLVIFIVSAIASGAMGVGIDFGDAKTAIPKAAVMLLSANLVSMIPFVGRFAELFVWLILLMTAFSLDIYEARIVVGINWLLNFLFKFFMVMLIISAIQHGGDKLDDFVPAGQFDRNNQMDDDKLSPSSNRERIEDMGGEVESIGDDLDGPVTKISFAGKPVGNDVLEIVKSFPTLKTLKMSGTDITDQGLAHLKQMESLVELDLSRTAVTDAGLANLNGLKRLASLKITGCKISDKGVRDLQKAIPKLKVIR